MSVELRLFSDREDNAKALEIAEQVCKQKTFSKKAEFYPYFTTKTALKTARIVVSTGKDYRLEPVSDAVRHNYKVGLTTIPDEYIAGIFAEILRTEGIDEFTKQWDHYVTDYIYGEVPGNPERVCGLLKEVSIKFSVVKLPDRSLVLTLKIIEAWRKDLALNRAWCKPIGTYKLSGTTNTCSLLQELLDLPPQRIAKRLSLVSSIGVKDAELMMMWCVATKVHPIRLLNYAGYWLTNREVQPEEFSLENPRTQVHEVELKYEGVSLGHEAAQPKFSAGFITRFIGLIMGVSWFDEEGEPIELATKEMYWVSQYFELEHLAMLGGLEWREMPWSVEDCEYYAANTPQTMNEQTVKEISASKAGQLRKPKKVKARPQPTGNPLFDAEMLEDD